MTTSLTPPSWWQTQLDAVAQWGLFHWTYIVTFIVANLIGVMFHV